jgi:cation diffusion facilitator family transporter
MASVAVALMTIALKTGAWLITDSVGLLSDAMESLVNLASAVFGLVMVTIAARPADEDHPYGHHKAEYFSSGFEGILIIAAALGIIWVAGHRFFDPQPIEQVGWGLALSVVSSALNGLLAWVMFRAAKEHRSIDLHMHMPASWSLGRAAAVRASVEQALMSAVPGLRATIQLLPSDVEAHFDDERDLI